MEARPATVADAAAMAEIYNEGIADRVATFETQPRAEADVRAWFAGVHPFVVVEDAGAVVAFAADAGYWKLVSRIFPENTASRGLMRTPGFREVGVYEKHARLDGVWKDVVIVERLIP